MDEKGQGDYYQEPHPDKETPKKNNKAMFFKQIVGRIHGGISSKEESQPLLLNSIALQNLIKRRQRCTFSVKELSQKTGLSPEEVRCLYRAFKNLCPDGVSTEETFTEIFETIFPVGDPTKFAHIVFLSLDKEFSGCIDFRECARNTLLRGVNLLQKGHIY